MPQVPAGWKETTLGEVLILNYGKGLTVEKRINGTIPVYWSSWITGYHNQELVWWPWIIIWRKWSVGKVYFSKQSFYPIDTVYYILPDKNYDLIFIYNLLLTLGLDKMNSDSAVPWLNRDNAYALPIHLPQLPEQQAIAAVLSSFDDKIELLRAENQTLEQMGQELFKERFGKWKVGDELPEGWRVGKIEDLTNYIASWGTPATKEASYYGWRINWFSTKELQDCFLFSSEKTITEDALKNSSAKEFPKDTVLMAIYAAPTVWRLWILTQSSAFNQAAVGLVAKDDIWMPFIYLLLKFHRDNFNNLANWAAQQNLNVSLVKNYEIIIPDQETLNQFDLVIKPLFNKIRENSEQIQNLSATRDQLLPKLMSGEVRVEF